MTIEDAIEMLREEYERALGTEWVNKPLAWALYRVWRRADRQGDQS